MKPPQIFKPEDFQEYCIKNPGAPHDVCIANKAQAIFEKWYLENDLEKEIAVMRQTKIFGKICDEDDGA